MQIRFTIYTIILILSSGFYTTLNANIKENPSAKSIVERKQSDDKPVLQPYRASYKVMWHHIPVATSYHELKQVNNGDYLAETKTRPFTELLPYRYQVTSRFAITDGRVIPQMYEIIKKEGRDKEWGRLRFDWANQQAINVIEPENTFSLGKYSQDKLSHTMQLRLDLKAFNTNLAYSIIQPDEQSTYNFRILDELLLKTKLGELDVLKLRHTSSGSDRSTELWLAKTYDYLPVLIKQYRNDKLVGQLLIQSYESLSP